MIKKINIFLVLLLLLISVGAVSAADDGNMTDMVSSEAISDTIEVSSDENIDYSDTVLTADDSSVLSAATHTINNNNYNQYFNSKTGELVSSSVKSGDTIKLDGSFSGTSFNFDKPVNIVGTSKNKLSNVMITLSANASGSSISGLNIENTKDETYGIFLNSASKCVIKDCTIKNTGKSSYCICVANGANYNNVTNNDLKAYGVTYGHNARSTPPLLLSGSHHNYIANNNVECDDANGIYLSTYAGGPLKGGDSNFNVIFNNCVHYNVLPTSWAYGIQAMGSNNVIDSNTVIGGYRGVSTSGTGNNITNNKIISITGADYTHPGVESGGEYGIVASYNSFVSNNNISGAKIISTGAGITVLDNSVVENNWVEVTLKGRGIVGSGSNVIIENNIVFTESGSGIYEKDEGSGLLVKNNNVTSVSGVGILIEKVSSKRMPKNVTIIGNVISTGNTYAIDASGAQKDSSDIDSFYENTIIGTGKINTPNGVYDSSKPTYSYTKGKIHTITPDNIRDYINDNGGLTSEINDLDTLNFEGTFRNEVIYVTKQVKITGKNPIFYNSTFKVTSGNVLIENLTIINSEAERVNAWGIYVNQAPGVRIMNNKISVNDSKAAYAIYILESTDIDVLNNELSSEGDYLTFTLLAYACEDCNFANNIIHTLGTGEVYNFKSERCIDGNEVVIDGVRYCIDGNELFIDGVHYCIDGDEIVVDGKAYCVDGNEITIDGKSYKCIDGNEITIDGKTYCIDGNEITVDGQSYKCIDGNEVTINGKSFCIDGSEVTVDGENYCVDGNEYKSGNAHVVSEIYQTYGILLLYSSNNIISGNDVNVTSKLSKQQSTTGDKSSQNSIVGIDLYFNSHNNTFSDNNVYVKGKDNYIYGMGVLGYYTGHSAPEGQGATNNSFIGNTITMDGVYCVEGIIIGDESEDTLIEDNTISLKSEAVIYGIYFELSHKSTANNNVLDLNSQVIYGIQGYNSNNNVISNNVVTANAREAYGVLFSNGNNNIISGNKINSKGTGKAITVKNLDSIASGNGGLYLLYNSTNNRVENNEITSNKGYAVVIDEDAINNVIVDNYLDSEKGIGNKAVSNAKNNMVSDNYKYIATAKGDKVTVPYLGTGEFKVSFDKALNGAIVKFYDNEGNYFAQSKVVNGVATAKYKFDSSYIPAQYIFTAKLSKDNYKSSTFKLTAVVAKGDLVPSMENVLVIQGNSKSIQVKVLDSLGNPVSGAKVDYKRVNSAGRLNILGSAVTNSKGIATLSYKPSASLIGAHNIVAEIYGLSNYNNANTTANLKVAKKALISGAKAYSVYYGNTVKYKVRVYDLNGKAVGAGKIVTFKINGKTKTVKTTKYGYATYSVKFKAGTYTMKITFNGYSVSKKITFKPTLIAKNVVKKKAKTTKFTVKLVSKKGKILKNKKITFKFKGKKYTAKTNKKGIATLSLKNLKVGKYTITSTYGGCTVKKTIQIKK